MSSQIKASTQAPTPSAEYLKKAPATESASPSKRSQRAVHIFWTLLAMGLLLNVLVIGLVVWRIFTAPKVVSPPPERRIQIPYGSNKGLWSPFHKWVVQEDGRNKPFETFSRETVRTITGREQFEHNDSVAVVLSWIMLYDEDQSKANAQSEKMKCNWEKYPFIRCDHHRLRKLLYLSHHGKGAKLTEEQLHGKYVEPEVIRHSEVLKKLVSGASQKLARNSKAGLTTLETKAREVTKRFDLYERVRSGGQEGLERITAPGAMGVVALDPQSSAWFSLRAVSDYLKDAENWKGMVQNRRLNNVKAYEGKSEPELPESDLKEIARAKQDMQTAYLSGSEQQFASASQDFLTTLNTVSKKYNAYPNTTTVDLELAFNSTMPFRKAWILSLLAGLICLTSLATKQWATVSKISWYLGLATYLGAIGWAVYGFYCRVTISGRPPVSDMYESVIWVSFMTAIFGLILELVYRKGVIIIAGALVSTLGFLLADQLPLSLNPDIKPLQAVLRSNYWLIIHVLTIVSSYSAFALAWGIGNFNLGLMVFAPKNKELIKTLSSFCYRAIQIGVILLAAGTFLGGFWAAESWGRFWGWDPKEVWALIALICYIIPLHARYVGWVKDFGLAMCSVICFASVVMAWYGVNFVLGAGLHSYGFGGGNDFWVYWCGLLNISLVIHAGMRYQQRHVSKVTTAES